MNRPILTALDLIERNDVPPLDPNRPIYFVASQLARSWPEIEPPDGWMALEDVPRSRLHLNENIWIVSTYLRLKEAGLPVKISDRLEPGHVNVCTDERLLGDPNSRWAYIVAVLGDRGYTGWSDFTVYQTPVMPNKRSCLIDMWPQPGLLPRDCSRGNQISRIAYFGYPGNLAAVYRSPSFARSLKELGVEWVTIEDPAQWHDYSQFDLCLAVRGIPEVWIRTKPSTKLVHAWITGCPALLGPEPAYQYWGAPGEDFVEIKSPEEAIGWVRRLKDDPSLYRAMIERGRAKAPSHDECAVLRQWEAMLAGPIREGFEDWKGRAKHRRGTQRVIATVGRRLFYLRAKGVRAALRGLAQRFKSGPTRS